MKMNKYNILGDREDKDLQVVMDIIPSVLDYIEEQRELNNQLVDEVGKIRIPNPCTHEQLLEVFERIRWSCYLEPEELAILLDLHERDKEARETVNRLVLKCDIRFNGLFEQNRHEDIRKIINSDYYRYLYPDEIEACENYVATHPYLKIIYEDETKEKKYAFIYLDIKKEGELHD